MGRIKPPQPNKQTNPPHMKIYSIEYRTKSNQTGYSMLDADTFIAVTNKFIAMHPEYTITAISEVIK